MRVAELKGIGTVIHSLESGNKPEFWLNQYYSLIKKIKNDRSIDMDYAGGWKVSLAREMKSVGYDIDMNKIS